MGIVDRYARSVQATELRDDEFHYNTEPLAAVAISSGASGWINDKPIIPTFAEGAGIGNLLFRVKYANDATSYNPLLVKWTGIVLFKSAGRKWPKETDTGKIADLSLKHWLNDKCPICTGKMNLATGVTHLALAGTPILSDEPCPACRGTGTKPILCRKEVRDYVLDMIEVLNAMAARCADVSMKKLSNDMDF